MEAFFDFKKWQNSVLAQARAILLHSGRVPGVSFVYASNQELPQIIKDVSYKLGETEPDPDHKIVMVPMEIPDDEIIQLFRKNLPKNDQHVIDDLIRVGHTVKADDPEGSVADAILDRFGQTREDMALFALRTVLKLTKSPGFIRVVEVNWRPTEEVKIVADLLDEKNVRKAIYVYMETEGGDRALMQPFYFEGMENERVIFGEIDDGTPNHFPGVDGRLLDLVKRDPEPAMPKKGSKDEGPYLN